MCLRIQVSVLSIQSWVYLYRENLSAVNMPVAEVAGKQRPKILASVFVLEIACVLASHYFSSFSTAACIHANNFEAVPLDLLRVYLHQLPKHADVSESSARMNYYGILEISGKRDKE